MSNHTNEHREQARYVRADVVRAVLEGLSYVVVSDGQQFRHWCGRRDPCTPACEAARALYAKLQPDAPAPQPVPLPKPSRRKSRKEQVAEDLKASDLMGQLTNRDDIDYGPHDSLPRGEHVANLRKE